MTQELSLIWLDRLTQGLGLVWLAWLFSFLWGAGFWLGGLAFRLRLAWFFSFWGNVGFWLGLNLSVVFFNRHAALLGLGFARIGSFLVNSRISVKHWNVKTTPLREKKHGEILTVAKLTATVKFLE